MENPHFVREGLRLRPVYQDRWLQAYSLAPPVSNGVFLGGSLRPQYSIRVSLSTTCEQWSLLGPF